MADPLLELVPTIQAALAVAFGEDFRSADPAIRPSQFADAQLNVALALSKRVGKPPRDVAQAIVTALGARAEFEKLEIAGPGYINITFSAPALSNNLRAVGMTPSLGIEPAVPADTVVIDYPSPNMAKDMHVGHLRSAIIGDALVRVLSARGHHVIRQNHIGDWGTPFGMLIEHIISERAARGSWAVSDLSDFYRAARKRFDEEPGFADRARTRVVQLQAGEPEATGVWKELIDVSVQALQKLYDLLGVTLRPEDVRGESSYNSALPAVVEDLRKLGLLETSDGAGCVFIPGVTGREGEPLPLIVQKQDGGFGYAATDLAGVRHRVSALHATRILYVVGSPQAQHLQMVFKVAAMANWLGSTRAEHVAFGSVLGSDGKMFKTRAGESVRLMDLLEEAIRRASTVIAEKNPDLSATDAKTVARQVGIGAIKYADLSSDRIKDYTFDYDRMLAFEGNTAPYAQYAHARMKSVLRKAGGSPELAALQIVEPAEKALALKILALPSVLKVVDAELAPHKLCTYVFELATLSSGFYEKCPILKAESDTVRASRLALAALTAQAIKRSLELLGIEAPEQM